MLVFHPDPTDPYAVKRERLTVTNMGNRRVSYELTDNASGRTWTGNLKSWHDRRIRGNFLRDVAVEELKLVVR